MSDLRMHSILPLSAVKTTFPSDTVQIRGARTRRRNKATLCFYNILATISMLYMAVMGLDSFGMAYIYYVHKCFRQDGLGARQPRSAVSSQDQYLNLVAGHQQWSVILSNMIPVWKKVRRGSIVLISLAVALLQIDSVFGPKTGNDVARTIVNLCILHSGVGIISSTIFLDAHICLDKLPVRLRWIKASESFGPASIDFWASLATPVSSLLWSIFFFVCTLLIIGWKKPQSDNMSPAGSGTMTDSASLATPNAAVFVTVLGAVKLLQLCRTTWMFWWDSRH